MKVTIRPMDDGEFDAYFEKLVPKYAEEGAKATGMARDAALEFARKQITGLLPDGRRTAGHHLACLFDQAGGRIGILWYAEQLDCEPPEIFIYDIAIDEAHRGRGVGRAAMRALERIAPDLDAFAISLHVFESNERAIRFYRRLGYESTSEPGAGGLRMTLRWD